MVCNLLQYYVANDIVEQVGADGFFTATAWKPMTTISGQNGDTVFAWGVACADKFYYSPTLVGGTATLVNVVSFDGLSASDFSDFVNTFTYKTSVYELTMPWNDGSGSSYTVSEALVLGADPNGDLIATAAGNGSGSGSGSGSANTISHGSTATKSIKSAQPAASVTNSQASLTGSSKVQSSASSPSGTTNSGLSSVSNNSSLITGDSSSHGTITTSGSAKTTSSQGSSASVSSSQTTTSKNDANTGMRHHSMKFLTVFGLMTLACALI